MELLPQKWKKVNIKEGHLYSEEGYLVWWRPDGIVDKHDPENDSAWILEK